MPVFIQSTHVATLAVPNSGNPAEAIKAFPTEAPRTITFQAQGASPEAARDALVRFLQAALDQAQA